MSGQDTLADPAPGEPGRGIDRSAGNAAADGDGCGVAPNPPDTPTEGEGGARSMTLRDFNPTGNPVVDEIKRRADELDAYIRANVPDNRHRSIALTNLEQSAMWAVKANFV